MSKFAILIANGEFSDTRLRRLSMPERDVEGLAAVLTDVALGGFDDVETLIDRDERQIRMALAKFLTDRRRDDLVVVYYSGHGILDEYGKLYFATSDTSLSFLSATALADDFVKERLDRSASKRQLLVLDCCHGGAFARGSKGVVGESVSTAARFINEGYGRIVLTASDATEYAWEGDEFLGIVEHSVFTHYVIEGIRSGDADHDGKGYITVDDVYDYVVQHIPETKQRPLRFGEREYGRLVLANNPRPKPVPLPDELIDSLKDRRPWVRRGAVLELCDLLNSPNHAQALSAQLSMKEVAERDDSIEIRALASSRLTQLQTEVVELAAFGHLVESNPSIGTPLEQGGAESMSAPAIIAETPSVLRERIVGSGTIGSRSVDSIGIFDLPTRSFDLLTSTQDVTSKNDPSNQVANDISNTTSLEEAKRTPPPAIALALFSVSAGAVATLLIWTVLFQRYYPSDTSIKTNYVLVLIYLLVLIVAAASIPAFQRIGAPVGWRSVVAWLCVGSSVVLTFASIAFQSYYPHDTLISRNFLIAAAEGVFALLLFRKEDSE